MKILKNVIKETKVDVNQIYFDCVNINSEVDRIYTNFTLVSNESCNTVYRFSAFHVVYTVLFKNGTTAEMKIKLQLQNAELTPGMASDESKFKFK